ncbi:hypothetical protein [Lignipirellula cremea]|uniref:hypothetical protein n=1 Tax=Lignipirellula cremea TaxID=2528010 RepID=UPI00119EC67A|nr:hypothetical protein [Lignipirellula cremea]
MINLLEKRKEKRPSKDGVQLQRRGKIKTCRAAASLNKQFEHRVPWRQVLSRGNAKNKTRLRIKSEAGLLILKC